VPESCIKIELLQGGVRGNVWLLPCEGYCFVVRECYNGRFCSGTAFVHVRLVRFPLLAAVTYGNLSVCCLADGRGRRRALVLLLALVFCLLEKRVRRRGVEVTFALPAQGAAMTAMIDFVRTARMVVYVRARDSSGNSADCACVDTSVRGIPGRARNDRRWHERHCSE
jgi:hypothetical protein